MTTVNIAGNILTRAVDLDNSKRYTEALVCYQEGLQLLVDTMKEEKVESKRNYLRSKIEMYMDRGEKLKVIINNLKDKGQYHEQIGIENDSTGHSYENIFKRFLDLDVSFVNIEDPYIRSHHQCQNLVRFCEVLIKYCPNLRKINLVTVLKDNDQQKAFSDITENLKIYNVILEMNYSSTLHDRQIMLSNGWIIKIGRGLDYFKPPKNQYCLGVTNFDYRHCHQTTVDIFHQNNVKES